MADKHRETERVGGPGASHENRRQPDKSKADAVQDNDARSGGDHPEQNKPWDHMPKVKTDLNASRADAGADPAARKPAPSQGRGVSNAGDTAKDDDLIHPIDRKQVR